MKTENILGLFFSPTGTTQKIVTQIAAGLNAPAVRMIDCTLRRDREACESDLNADLVILAAPVYYGRLPEEIVPFFKSLKGNLRPVVPVVVYGNREYEDALLELTDICRDRKFVPVAAGAFVAEHSYSTPDRPIAHARPDAKDIKQARKFGAAVKAKLAQADSVHTDLAVPGNRPYVEPRNLNMIKQARQMVPLTPQTDTDLCTQCGTCGDICPTGAIDKEDVQKTDRWNCIICFACVKNCADGARQMTDAHFHQAIDLLQKSCRARKEPQTFL